MAHKYYFRTNLQEYPIPSGYRIYVEGTEVVGTKHNKQETTTFIDAKSKWLELHTDYENYCDKNAIAVLGCGKGFLGTKRFLIGYLSNDLAKIIIENDFEDMVFPRLESVSRDKEGNIKIHLQILGPNDLETYSNWLLCWDN